MGVVRENRKERMLRLYDTHARTVWRICRLYLNEAEAEDAVHDVFEKYMNTQPVFKDTEHEKAWFVRVTVNRCHDLYRKRSKRTHDTLDSAADVAYTDSDEPEIFRIVHSLPEKYRAAIVLQYVEGYSVEETAKLLRVSVSAVKMRLSRGRDYIKDLLKGE